VRGLLKPDTQKKDEGERREGRGGAHNCNNMRGPSQNFSRPQTGGLISHDAKKRERKGGIGVRAMKWERKTEGTKRLSCGVGGAT